MIYNLPKIDLHCHLDGSCPPDILCELALERNIPIPNGSLLGYTQYLEDTLNCKSLVEYLQRFDFPISILQDKEALVKATRAVIKMLDQQGLIYVELRFAPQQHTHLHLSQEEALQAVLEGVEKERQESKIHVEIICCLMNYGDVAINEEANYETIDLVSKYLNKGVVLLDIAGAEGSNMMDFEKFFILASKKKIPYIIHAGEAGPASNVHQAIMLGASRIGHGVRSIEDNSVVNELIQRQIPIECCISSNLNCFVYNDIQSHPIRKLFDQGVIITINTDNMMFSNTTLDKEYEILQKEFMFTFDDLLKFNYQSLCAAACSEEVKTYLKRLYFTNLG